MNDIFFFVRIMVITIVVVLLMQVRIGNSTIEDEAMEFMTSSTLTKPINNVATGAVRVIRNTWTKFTRTINTNFTNALRSENQPGSRQSTFSLERSQSVQAEQTARLNRMADQSANTAQESTASYMDKFKSQAARATKKIRSKFIDETEVPGDSHKASSVNDDELTEE